jgi:hypothetical protein
MTIWIITLGVIIIPLSMVVIVNNLFMGKAFEQVGRMKENNE